MVLSRKSYTQLLLKWGVLQLALLLVGGPQVFAFDFDGLKWKGAEAEFYVKLTGIAGSGISWNNAFIAAMNEWTEKTPFNFILREEVKSPCFVDGVSSVALMQDLCGTEFGTNTLAVTFIRQTEPQLLGQPNIIESDIIVKDSGELDIFDGNLRQPGIQGLDFRRIALHELGHVIGLGHETSNAAIMAPDIGNVDRLQADDIAAVEALYGGLSNCTISNLNFGLIANALDVNDCTVQELTAGSTDSSFIDIYRFDLSSETLLEFTMTSSTLDSVLLLSDTDLEFLALDDKSRNECDSVLSQTLPPGSYFLHANTYDVPVRADCGNSGEYLLSVSFSSGGPISLGPGASLLGSDSSAGFSGGITRDNGLSFGNRFTPEDSLDITAKIEIDPLHQGQPGLLVVAAVIGEQTLFMNQQGQFVDSAANPGFIPSASVKFLSAVEQLNIVTDLVPAALNIQDLVVNFHVAYGLISSPSELYYNQSPLNLTVSP